MKTVKSPKNTVSPEETNALYNEMLQKLTPENANSVVLSLGYPSGILLSAGISDGENVLVALDVGKGKDIDFNIIKTAFDKHKGGVIGWINGGDLKYADKKRALDYLLSTPAPIAGAANNQEQKTAVMTVKEFTNPTCRF